VNTPTPRPDDAARRAYWREQMELAFGFMNDIRSYPVAECGEPVASLIDAAKHAGVQIEFATSKFAGRFDRVYFMRESLVADVMRIAAEMNQRGWVLRIEDGFRTPVMQKAIATSPLVFEAILRTTTWENDGVTPSPELMLRRITAVSAMRPKIGTHMSATAIDISVLDMASGRALDRGGGYPDMSEITPMRSPFISELALRNRLEITAVMERHGFKPYPYEFWHYNQGDAYVEYLENTDQPARYGPVEINVNTGKVTPITDSDQLLVPVSEVRELIQQALRE